MTNEERANEILDTLRGGIHYNADTTVWVSVASLAKLLADGEHLRHQVTDLQRSNTVLEARARAAEADSLCMRDVVRANGAESISELRAECEKLRGLHEQEVDYIARAREATGEPPGDDLIDIVRRMRADLNAARAALAAEVEAGKQFAAYLTKVLDVGSAGLESIWLAAKRVVRERDEMRAVRDEALKAVASVTASRDALASSSVPVELARLYRAAQRMLTKMGDDTQRLKLAEECAEYIAEAMREDERFSAERLYAELHDVLTVALSLCEPALMAKAADRLEGRLAK